MEAVMTYYKQTQHHHVIQGGVVSDCVLLYSFL
jgi:hypothetical protein